MVTLRWLVWLLVLSLAGAQAQEGLWRTREGREVIFNALVDTFRENYWQEDYTDWDGWAERYREAVLGAETRGAFDAVARRMVQALDDQHSSWVGLVSYVDDEALPREPASRGLGIAHDYLPGTGIVIRRVYPETPAAAAGLHRGDVIEWVNGQDVRQLGNRYGVGALLANAVATGEAELQVRRKLERLSVSVTPGPIYWAEVQRLPQAEMLDATTAYLYLPTFNAPHIAEEVHRLLAELKVQGAQLLILDLRGNLGGRLSELGLVLGAFIEGPWARAVSRGGILWESSYQVERGWGRNILAADDPSLSAEQKLDNPVHFQGPLVVLVDRYNSSAGEIAALVLQNLGRATIVGEITGGNVEAVRGFDLPDGSLVMVAVANMQAVSGEAFDGGVVPDVEAREDLHELARGFDAPLSEALRVLKVLPFTPGKYF